MFVDPLSRDIYIISKRENPKHLYRAAYPQSSSGTTTLQLMTTFLTDSTWLTAADISPNANEIIVRSTGTTSGRLYQRPAGGSIADAFATTPITIPLLSEPQGEAIAFDPNGWGYFTTSEGSQRANQLFQPPAGSGRDHVLGQRRSRPPAVMSPRAREWVAAVPGTRLRGNGTPAARKSRGSAATTRSFGEPRGLSRWQQANLLIV